MGPAAVTSELYEQGERPKKRYKQLTYDEAKQGTIGTYVRLWSHIGNNGRVLGHVKLDRNPLLPDMHYSSVNYKQ